MSDQQEKDYVSSIIVRLSKIEQSMQAKLNAKVVEEHNTKMQAMFNENIQHCKDMQQHWAAIQAEINAFKAEKK